MRQMIPAPEFFRDEVIRMERLKAARKLVVERLNEAGITELIPMMAGAIGPHGYVTVPHPPSSMANL